jgi:NAD(P)H-hydrate repair Nnr-like enzyme with NAD(P)H-hydrate dehydratase domain
MLATGLPADEAGAVGAFLHGLAGVLAVGSPAAPITAMDIAAHVPEAIRAVRR